MIPEKGKLLKRFVPFLLAGLFAFVIYIYFFVPGGPLEIVSTLQRTNLFLFLLAAAATMLDVVFFALTWHYFLIPLSVKVPFKKTFMYVWASIFIDLIVPAESVSGEISRAYLMSKETGGETGKIVASLVSHRILAMLVTMGSLITGVFAFFLIGYRLSSPLILNLTLFITVVTIVVAIFLLLLCTRPKWTENMINAAIRCFNFVSRNRWKDKLDGLKLKMGEALKAFHEAIDVLRRKPRNLIEPIIFSIASWTLSMLVSYIVFFSLNYHISFSIVAIVASITVSIKAVPFGIPTEAGVSEIVMTSLYVTLDPAMGIALAATATVLIRILTGWLRLLIGFAAFQWVGIKTLVR